MGEYNMIKQSLLVTVIAINLMLGSLLVTKNIVKISGVTPAFATPSETSTRIDFVTEYSGKNNIQESASASFTGHEGVWVVEHYKEYEVHYNKKGEIIYKKRTGNEENIRYWVDKNNHSY